jgi:ubiquinone biosynthesis protein COQ9
MPTAESSEFAHRIVDTAVDLAEKEGWESVRLHQVATVMGVGLADIRRHCREKDELIDAWFDRADDAVLALSASGDLAQLSPRERLFRLIMAWLDALEDHRRVSRQMILAKLEPGHLHIQIPALIRISRTVQWIREGALLEDAGLRRALMETAVTSLYLTTFIAWMNEDAPGSPRTRRLLDSLLARAEGILQAFPLLAGKTGAGG